MLKSKVKNLEVILTELGYKLIRTKPNEYRSRAVYRNGKTENSLAINGDGYYDFGVGKGGSIEQLIALTKGIPVKDAQNFLTYQEDMVDGVIGASEHKIKKVKYYQESDLSRLVKDYSYFEKRGISAETQKAFEVGVATTEGKLKNRVVFPIRDMNNKIIGFAGRYKIDPIPYSTIPKWKHMGPTSDRIYPYNLLHQDIIKSKNIILVESIGDLLSLYETGFRNVVCTFGTNLYTLLVKYIIGVDRNVIISTNNDVNNRGQMAAEKFKSKLCNYFNADRIQIILPTSNDWNDQLLKEGKESIKSILGEQ